MTAATDLHGVWLLRSYYIENLANGERTEAFGPNPNGVLILLPEGRMAAVVTPSEQASAHSEADQAAAYRELIAYSGRYRLAPPDRFVTTVDVAWFQPWVGSDQARRYRLHEHGLDIVSDPTTTPLTGDASVVGVLAWVRESHAR